jgi:hypothetical protein
MTTSRHFVFLEFTDPEIRSILTSLRDALYGTNQRDPIHITVRGPYKDLPNPRSLEDSAEALRGNFVSLSDVGMFQTNKGYAVYLNAYSRIFDEIWWKPDFGGPKNKKIPHLTLFETRDKSEAHAVRDFLLSEQIDIVTHGIDLTVYTSKQSGLWPEHHAVVANSKRNQVDRLLVNPGLIERARKLSEYLHEPEHQTGFQFALV